MPRLVLSGDEESSSSSDTNESIISEMEVTGAYGREEAKSEKKKRKKHKKNKK